MNKKYLTYFSNIESKIKKIGLLYWTLIIVYLLILINPEIGIIILFISVNIIFIAFEKASRTEIVVFSVIWLASVIYAPGHELTPVKVNQHPAQIKISNDSFVAKYLVGDQWRLKLFKTVPNCKRYEIYQTSKTFKYLWVKYTVNSRLKLGCVENKIKDTK